MMLDKQYLAVFRIAQGRCHGNKFLDPKLIDKIVIPHFHSTNWHLETDWKITTPLHALTVVMIPLYIV